MQSPQNSKIVASKTLADFEQLPYSAILQRDLERQVKQALWEDIDPEGMGQNMETGDVSAQLIPAQAQGEARVISREKAVICGQAWVNEVFKQLDPQINLQWQIDEGQIVEPNQVLFTLSGSLRSLLTGERSALNFLQSLSGTATTCRHYAEQVKHTAVKLLDTRKTIPGLRTAQKYAVTVGGCHNHRIGLYDAFLIKENHIMACGGIEAAIRTAKQNAPGKRVEVEVESLSELDTAIQAQADIVMLDNFSLDDIRTAVKTVQQSAKNKLKEKRCKLEASGNINNDTLVGVAETGVDYISIGALTKHVQAIDLSLRVT